MPIFESSLEPEFTVPRRKDRAVQDPAWIKSFLKRAPFGVLAVNDHGQPYLHPNLFVYSEASHVIYSHGARHGRLVALVENETPVCFNVSEMGRLLPGRTAMQMSMEYASVVVFGSLRIIENPDEASHALELLMQKYFPHLIPGRDYPMIPAEDISKTSIYKITISQWSAKRKEAAPDYPGAFYFDEAFDKELK